MATYQSQTIKKTLEDIENGKLIIPALQRNFVWPDYKITDLFDSLVRGYPIGTFLFWDVNQEAFEGYSFNKVLTEYKESRNKKYRGEPAEAGRTEYCAVLDGQQRITSLAISVLGKYTVHQKGALWDSDSSFTDKYLCVNILHSPKDDDDKYQFRFMPVPDIETLKPIDSSDDDDNGIVYEYWVKVADVYRDDSIFDPSSGGLFMYISKLESLDPNVFTLERRTFINNLLSGLRNTLVEKEVVSVYTTPNNLKLNEVVDIFVRVNSGGQKLDDADLILSIASGDNAEESFYDKVSSAVDEIKSATKNEFKCDKKFVLSVALLFTGAASLSLKKPENYSRESVGKIIDIWDTLIEKIKAAVIFVDKLDFDVSKLSSNVVIPIAYYFMVTDRPINYYDLVSSKKDRVYIRQWIFRTIINHVFDEGTGKSLIRIRNVMDEALKINSYFPLDKFMALERPIKKPLLILSDQINEILDWKWPDYRITPLLKEISPAVPTGEYSQDHMWPRTYLTTKKKLDTATPNLSEADRQVFKSRADFLPNIQLLTSNENSQKNDRFFDSWISTNYIDDSARNALFERNIIPVMEDYSFESFVSFFDKRSALLKQKIHEAFPDSIDSINKRYDL